MFSNKQLEKLKAGGAVEDPSKKRLETGLNLMKGIILQRILQAGDYANLVETPSIGSRGSIDEGPIMERNPLFSFEDQMLDIAPAEDSAGGLGAGMGQGQQPGQEFLSRSDQMMANLMQPITQVCLEYLALKAIAEEVEHESEEPTEDMENFLWLLNLIFGLIFITINIGIAVFTILYLSGVQVYGNE